jgi:hypothetical protein
MNHNMRTAYTRVGPYNLRPSISYTVHESVRLTEKKDYVASETRAEQLERTRKGHGAYESKPYEWLQVGPLTQVRQIAVQCAMLGCDEAEVVAIHPGKQLGARSVYLCSPRLKRP